MVPFDALLVLQPFSQLATLVFNFLVAPQQVSLNQRSLLSASATLNSTSFFPFHPPLHHLPRLLLTSSPPPVVPLSLPAGGVFFTLQPWPQCPQKPGEICAHHILLSAMNQARHLVPSILCLVFAPHVTLFPSPSHLSVKCSHFVSIQEKLEVRIFYVLQPIECLSPKDVSTLTQLSLFQSCSQTKPFSNSCERRSCPAR